MRAPCNGAPSDGDALTVEQGAQVIGVQAVDHEGDDADFVGGGADDADPRQGAEGVVGVGDQGAFVGGDGVRADGVDPIQGDAESNAARDVRGAGFEFVRQSVVGRAVKGNALNHFPASRQGGMASRSSRRPQTNPMPVGP